MTDPTLAARQRRRSRLILLLVVAMFFASFGLALFLRFTGWMPTQTRNFGELLREPLDVSTVTLVDAADAQWRMANQEHRWTALVRVPGDCAAACWQQVAVLQNVRASLGRHAPRLRLVLLDSVPPLPERGTLRGLSLASPMTPLPAPLGAPLRAGPEVWLVDPHGYVVLHYPAGFNPSELRKDLGRVIK